MEKKNLFTLEHYEGKILAGVVRGLGNYYGWSNKTVYAVRACFVLTELLFGTGIVVYLGFAIYGAINEHRQYGTVRDYDADPYRAAHKKADEIIEEDIL